LEKHVPLILYRANVVCALLYGICSTFVSYAYALYLPHPVGHVYSVASIVVIAAWAAHCVLLVASRWQSAAAIDKLGPLAVALMGLISAVVSWVNYYAQAAA
jgi:hypothetical protein